MAGRTTTATSNIILIITVVSLFLFSTVKATNHHNRSSSNNTGTTPNTLSPFCALADDKAMCTQLVHSATTWPQAMKNAVDAVTVIVSATQPRVDKSVQRALVRVHVDQREEIEASCTNMFQSYLSYLQQSLDILDWSVPDLEEYFYATEFSTCKDKLLIVGISLPELNQISDRANKLSAILVAILDRKPLM